MKRTAGKRRYLNTGPDTRTREIVGIRAGWSCEICGGNSCFNIDPQIHHRRPRALGGSRREDTNQPHNLLYIGADCHRFVESRRGEALHNGWLVPQQSDPAQVAVLIHNGSRWVYLAADGTYSDNPPGQQ